MLLTHHHSVLIITILRICSLHSVSSPDYTYSKGYLGLLSVLGALLSIITCCSPGINFFVRKIIGRRSRTTDPAPQEVPEAEEHQVPEATNKSTTSQPVKDDTDPLPSFSPGYCACGSCLEMDCGNPSKSSNADPPCFSHVTDIHCLSKEPYQSQNLQSG